MLTLNAESLTTALSRVIHGTGKQSNLPILSHVLIDAPGDGTATLTGTDMNIAVTVQVNASGELSATLPCRELLGVIGLSEAPDVEISADGAVKRGTMTATLPAQPACDFPDALLTDKYHTAGTLSCAALLPALNRVRLSIGVEETRYYLNGIHITEADGRLDLCATDGHRLTTEHVTASLLGKFKDHIVNRHAVSILTKLLPDYAGTVRIEQNDGHKGRFIFGDTTVSYKAIDGTWPAVARVIPDPAKTLGSFTCDAAELCAIADKVADLGVRLVFEIGETTTVSVKGGITISLPLPGTLEGKPIRIGFQARYIRDMLADVPGAVTMRFTTPGDDPVLITADALPGWRGVLMPMTG